MLSQLNPAFEKLSLRYRMPAEGDIPSAAFSDFQTGEQVELAQYKGRYVLMEFWVTECEICQAQKSYLHEAWETFHEAGFEILAFSQDAEKQALRDYLEEHPVPWHQCFDQDPAHRNSTALKVRVVPYNMMVDPAGRVVKVNLREQDLLDFLHDAFPEIAPPQ